jgi:hypothetical protein
MLMLLIMANGDMRNMMMTGGEDDDDKDGW